MLDAILNCQGNSKSLSLFCFETWSELVVKGVAAKKKKKNKKGNGGEWRWKGRKKNVAKRKLRSETGKAAKRKKYL